jgi:hypothetical protein
MGEGELPDRAKALVVAWEARGAAHGLERDGPSWDSDREWKAEQRRPPTPSV